MLTDDEKNVLAQALTDYMDGIQRTDLPDKDKQWCEDQVSSIESKVLGDNENIPLGLSKWTVARLKDSRDSGEIDSDVSDAVIEREAAKLEVLCFQLASSFVDNEFEEKE